MSSFFQNFPLVGYNFGTETTPALFQDISAYIKIIDDIKDDIAFYSTVHIQDYDRPDSFSYKLYGTTEFYWTFYYLNDDLRESGWPLPQQDLLPKAKIDYPHQTIVTTADISSIFLPGQTALGLGTGNASGIVVKRYLDLGQVVVEGEIAFSSTETMTSSGGASVTTTGFTQEYNAIHHYEIEQESGDTSIKINIGTSNADYPTATAITNYEYEQEEQDNKRKIRLLDPSFIDDFIDEFKILMKESNI